MLSVISNQAGAADSTNRVSYRHQDYAGDVEVYATIPVKPVDTGAVSLVFNIREVPGGGWDSYWLTWDVVAATDVLRIERIRDNTFIENVARIELEMSSGDRFMARHVGAQLEGWVNQGGSWVKVLEATDSEFIGGKVGLFNRGSVQRLDDLGGGAYVPPEPPPLEQSTGTCGIGVHGYSRSACRGNGVNTLTGAFTTRVVDLALPGIGVPFSWTRTYSSNAGGASRLGPGWTQSFATHLVEEQPLALGATTGSEAAAANDPADFKLFGDEGQEILYRVNTDGTFVGAPGSLSTLSRVGDVFVVLRKDQVAYTYNGSGRLTSIEDRNGQGLSFEYDDPGTAGKLTTIVDSVGRQIAVTYDGDLIDRVTLPDGRFVDYGYTNGRLSSVLDARGQTTTYGYDAAGRLTLVTDQNMHQAVRNEYDSSTGRVATQWDAHDHPTTFEGDPAAGGAVTMTDARGKEWSDVYDRGVIDERVDPLGHKTSFEYDLDLNVTQITDPRENTTLMEYDDAGNLTKWTAPAPLSFVEEWTYTARNDPLTYTDGREHVTEYGYDGDGNLTSVLEPPADESDPLTRPLTVYERDPAGTGLVKAIIDPLNKRTDFSYLNGNLTEIRTHLGHRTTMGYDDGGRMRTLVDPRGNEPGKVPADFTWTFEYNAHDQLHKQTDPLGHLTELRYDNVGNLERRIDAKGHETVYGYWESNGLKSVTEPDPDGPTEPLLPPVTLYTYDEVGNLKIKTDAEQRLTIHDYDDANRLSKTTAPDNRVWTYDYDDNGNLDLLVDANGNATPTAGDGQTIYGYDPLNRLTVINYSDTTPDVTFDYDENSNRTHLTDGSGTETYTYDPLNRLKTITRGAANAITYTYDKLNLVGRSYPGSTVMTYLYDDDQRLSRATVSGRDTNYTYDAGGNVLTTTLPAENGYVETRTYDRAGRLTEVKNERQGTALSRFVANLDEVGSPDSVVRSGALSQTHTYDYDNLDRLKEVLCTQAGCPAGSAFIRWTYDRVGNRLSEARPAGTTTYSYNAADELTQAGSTLFAYDKNGNQLQKGTRSFTYDLANRLRTTTQGSTTTTYAYDGGGKRLRASTGTQNSQITNLLWDPSFTVPQLARETNGSGNDIRRYTYGLSRTSLITGSSTRSYYHHDLQGSVANMSSSNGLTRWTYSYEPFGKQLTAQSSGSAPDNVSRFTGEYLDPTGLYHLRARQYDPDTGRFLSRDPIASSGSPYAYGGNMPTVFGDPTGLWLEWLDDAGHAALDAVGLIPLLGEPADLLNCAWYGAQDEHIDAALSCTSAIPVLGYLAVAAKWGRRADRALDAAKAGDDVLPAFPNALAGGPANVHVYHGLRDGRSVYAGITNDIARRQSQHGARFALEPITTTPMTRGQARAIEEALIVRNPGFENVRHAISPTHVYYDQALAWGRAWLRANGP